MSASPVTAPEHLTAQHDVAAFDSGVLELDTWLKRRALQIEGNLPDWSPWDHAYADA